MSTIALGALAAGAAGCAENDSTIYVVHMEPEARENECQVDNDPNGLVMTLGAFDPLVRSSYIGYPLVANGMVARGDEDLLRAESNHVQLFELEREVLGGGGELLSPPIGDPNSVIIPVAGFVSVGAPTNPGYGFTTAQLLSDADVAGRSGTVVVRFILRGETMGGKDVETGIFDFPIQIIPGGTSALPRGIVDCGAAVEDEDTPCRLGQDEGVGPVDPRLLGLPCE